MNNNLNLNNVATSNVVPNASMVNNANQNVVNNEKKKEKMDSSYVAIIVFVVIVLLIAVVLLVFLLGGSILNRNRLSCSKVSEENGYTYTINRTYKFDDSMFTRIYDTHIYEYNSTLTEEMYNQEYSDLINSSSTVSGYGFDTSISKEGNTVTIKAYTVNVSASDKDAARNHANSNGFICK